MTPDEIKKIVYLGECAKGHTYFTENCPKCDEILKAVERIAANLEKERT